MAKKNTKNKIYGIKKILILSLILLMSVSIYYVVENKKVDNSQSVNTPNIQDKIDYEIPLGWSENVIVNPDNTEIIEITSMDYKEGAYWSEYEGSKISIYQIQNIADTKRYLDDHLNPPNGIYGAIDPESVEELQISGRRAVKEEGSLDGAWITYYIEDNNAIWVISGSWAYKKYQNEINNFLNSVRFVE